MKVKLTPVYLESGKEIEYGKEIEHGKEIEYGKEIECGKEIEYGKQLSKLAALFGDYMELLPSVIIGNQVPGETDAVLFLNLEEEMYQKAEELKKIDKPVLLLPIEIMSIAMWDIELQAYLQSKGILVLAPYSIELAKSVLRAMQVKKRLKGSVFLVYQEILDDWNQQGIDIDFLRWEKERIQVINEVWGIQVKEKSLKELIRQSLDIPDEKANEVLQKEYGTKSFEARLDAEQQQKAAKVYLAVKKEISRYPALPEVLVNYFNDPFYKDAIPCLSWNLLSKREKLFVACEADILALLAKCLLDGITEAPVLMSNLYPFLMGMAAARHEKMLHFPLVPHSENYLLAVHCGYFGSKEDSPLVNAGYQPGKVRLAQLHQDMKTLLIIEGEIEEFIKYGDSVCRYAALIRVKDGHRLMDNLFSHHAIFLPGILNAQLIAAADILGITIRNLDS